MAGAFRLLGKKRKLIFWGHALSGVRVHRVQKVQRVQRGRLTGLRPEGCGRLSAAGCVRWRSRGQRPFGPRVVVAASPQFLKSALRIYLSASYGKISILLTSSLCSPPPIRAAPDFPLCRGQNKTPRNTLFINGSTVSTGYSATVEVLHRTSKWGEVRRLACPLRRFPFAAPPNCGGKVVAPATKGGLHFFARRAIVWFSPPKAA